jgi:multimeric flavodoxin WrbA
MNILAIMGSPRKEGNTYLVTKRIEEKLQQLGVIDLQYLFLRDADIKMCLGCTLCYNKGELFCPHKDDVPAIVDRMLQADGVIFASPTFVVNVSGLMKNFIDRLSYVCHRPAFCEKEALLVSTVAALGVQQTLIALASPVISMGFHVAGKVGVVTNSNAVCPVPERSYAKIDKAAESFFKAIQEQKYRSPHLYSLIGFRLRQKFFGGKDDPSYDARYWNAKGWLDPQKDYFIEVRVNGLKKIVARGAAKALEIIL